MKEVGYSSSEVVTANPTAYGPNENKIETNKEAEYFQGKL